MEKLNCLVIDDEPLACKGIIEYISEIEQLQVLAAVNNPAEAVKYLEHTHLMYLDINMPRISGIEFLQQVKNPPLTIITTAYQQYALQSYELDVVDYLLKPISFPRFLKASTKAIEYYKLLHQQTGHATAGKYFFVKSNGILEKVNLPDIDCIEALSNYVIIHCGDKKIIAYLTMKQIIEYLPAASFIQVHKSFIVAADKVSKVDRDELVIHTRRIPIGSNYRETVNQQLLQGRILKR